MGKELAEGKVHSLERQIALSRTYAADIRARYVELEDHLHALDMENESLHQQVYQNMPHLQLQMFIKTAHWVFRESPAN